MSWPSRTSAADAPQAGGAAQPQRFHDILTRSVWALILSPPLIACLALAALTLTHRPVPVHTGDALLDAYLQAVFEQNIIVPETARTAPLMRCLNYRALPEDRWLELEQRFEKDPRFWLFCSERRGELDAIRFLEQARQHKATCLTGLFSLLGTYRRDWRVEAYQAGRLPNPRMKATREEIIIYSKQLREEIDTRHGADDCELLDDITELAPDNPFPKYVIAMDEVLRGNLVHGRAMIREGNRLAVRLQPASGNARVSLADQLQVTVGLDELTAAWLLDEEAVGVLARIQDQLRCPARILITEAIDTDDDGLLQEIHLMGCNIARTTEYDISSLESSRIMCQEVVDAVRQPGGRGLSQAQTASLGEVQKVLADIKASTKQQKQQRYLIWQALAKPQSLLFKLDLPFAGERHWAILELQTNIQSATALQAYRVKMAKLFSKLERFDYVTLTWREDAP